MQVLLKRLRDEGGSVGVLLAMAMFVVVGMLVMTFNTAQLSKEKMRLQDAADAAALEHSLWQARSMNALQNMNDEAYITCQTAQVLITIAEWAEIVAKPLTHGIISRVVAAVFRVFALVAGGMSSLMSNVVLKYTLKYFSLFYARATVPLGYLAAQQFAYRNGATPILPAFNTKTDLFGTIGIYSVGLSVARPAATFVLPVKQKSMNKAPWKHTPKESVFTSSNSGFFKKLYELFRIGKPWDYHPWVSTNAGEKDSEAYAQTADVDESQLKADEKVEERLATCKREIANDKNEILRRENENRQLEREMRQLEDRQKKDTDEYRQLEAKVKANQAIIDKMRNGFTTRYKGVDRDGNINDEELRKYARSTVPGASQPQETSNKNKDQGKGKNTDKNKDKGNGSGSSGSDKPILPPPTIWVAFKAANSIETVPLDAWGEASKKLSKCPIIAISAARCVTGDLIPHNASRGGGKLTQRPYGFGAGATAKLVPVQEAFDAIGNGGKLGSFLGGVIGAAIYH